MRAATPTPGPTSAAAAAAAAAASPAWTTTPTRAKKLDTSHLASHNATALDKYNKQVEKLNQLLAELDALKTNHAQLEAKAGCASQEELDDSTNAQGKKSKEIQEQLIRMTKELSDRRALVEGSTDLSDAIRSLDAIGQQHKPGLQIEKMQSRKDNPSSKGLCKLTYTKHIYDHSPYNFSSPWEERTIEGFTQEDLEATIIEFRKKQKDESYFSEPIIVRDKETGDITKIRCSGKRIAHQEQEFVKILGQKVQERNKFDGQNQPASATVDSSPIPDPAEIAKMAP